MFGSAIHKTLESFYMEMMIGRKMLAKELHQIFEQSWKDAAEGRIDIQFSEGKNFGSYLIEGKELLTTYYNKLHEDDFKILSIEEPFSFTIDGLDVPIIGVTDLVQEDESGTILISDWKTSKRSYTDFEISQNLQLTLYFMALRANGYKDRDILLRFDCLIKTKIPKRFEYYSTRTELDERRAIKKILHVWDGIKKGVFIPNDNNNWRCKYCEYKKYCDEWLEGG